LPLEMAAVIAMFGSSSGHSAGEMMFTIFSGGLNRRASSPRAQTQAVARSACLHSITLAKRTRAWEACELFDLINDVERELATPTDTEAPTRPSPRQRTTTPRR
jgi:hypothetical protein